MKVYIVYYICELHIETLYEILGVYYRLEDAQEAMNKDADEFETQIKRGQYKGYKNYKRFNEKLSVEIIGSDYKTEWNIEEVNVL